jgi:hypothetical protein
MSEKPQDNKPENITVNAPVSGQFQNFGGTLNNPIFNFGVEQTGNGEGVEVRGRAWNVPHGKNQNFTGREAVLVGLERVLKAAGKASVVQAIAGLGGVGKTQLVVEYVYRHEEDYRVVWWVRAEQELSLQLDLGGLAVKLGLVGAEEELAGQVRAAQGWLEENESWLLIFDNAEEPTKLQPYLPKRGGHCLVTSRNQNWRGRAGQVELRPMERAEAVEFLLKRTGQADKEAAGELAELLGDLPLALEQAGAYVEVTGRDLRSYIGLFRNSLEKVLAAERAQPATGYPETVLTTWELAFKRLEVDAEEAVDLLRLLVFLAPEDLPLWALEKGRLFQHEMGLDEALEGLRRYSLAEVGDGKI